VRRIKSEGYPKFILKDEVKEPTTYFSVLQVISQGEHKIGKIASKLGIETKNLTSFIEKMIKLEIIERKVPVTEENPAKSKKGLYFIKDNFFNFWFRYVFSYQSFLETERYDFVLDKIKKEFNHFVSFVFEEISKDYLLNKAKLPFAIQKIGRWWDKNVEIDVLVLGENEILFGECKYWDRPVGLNVLKELKEKAQHVNWKKEKRKEHFAIFSRKGFTEDLLAKAEKDKNLYLFSLDEF